MIRQYGEAAVPGFSTYLDVDFKLQVGMFMHECKKIYLPGGANLISGWYLPPISAFLVFLTVNRSTLLIFRTAKSKKTSNWR